MPADLVLLHGFAQTGASWEPVVRTLAGRYRAIAPDLRGHGTASAARPVSFDTVTADLDALIAGTAGCGPVKSGAAANSGAAASAAVAKSGAANSGAAASAAVAKSGAANSGAAASGLTLAGYSMGGRIALHYALVRPGRVARLVLIGASPGLADPAEREARRAADEALARRIKRRGVHAFADEWEAQPMFAGRPAAVAEAARADRLRNDAAGLAAALRGLGTGAMEPLWHRLGELRLPVALVVGERDDRFRAIAERMAALLPEARIHVVPGAGHAAHLEQPGALDAL